MYQACLKKKEFGILKTGYGISKNQQFGFDMYYR